MHSPTFFSVFRSEHFKLKRNLSVYLVLIFPLIVTLVADTYILYKAAETSSNSAPFESNPWSIILGRYIFQFYIMYPIVTAITCYSLIDVEYRNNGFKRLFSLPVTKELLFLSKVLVILEVILISIIIAYCLFLSSGYLLGELIPELGFQNYEIRQIALSYFFRLFLGISAISLIQLGVSILLKNFVLPISLACGGTFFTLFAQRSEFIDYIPYNIGYKVFNDFSIDTSIMISKVELINVSYFLLFLIISYILFIRIKV